MVSCCWCRSRSSATTGHSRRTDAAPRAWRNQVHAPETARPTPATLEDADGALSFLWLELTGRCNLQCVHCYTESDPWSGHRDLLSAEDYEDVMSQAHALGCRQVQLI